MVHASRPMNIEGTFDAATGHISLGSTPRKIRPELKDYELSEREPTRESPEEVHDIGFRVRHNLWRAMQPEEGLESPEMKAFLSGLTAEERFSLDHDVFFSEVNFEWLVCVPASQVQKVIQEITDLLRAPNKHCPDFYRKRSALHAMLEDDTDRNLQTRRNAIYVRHNPAVARQYGWDEAYYRERFQ